jgi:UDP-glucose 6-dehydrogenase|tara:strand:- start:1468 stop:1890 length:423 start_codon:yes stop_codon:yes gene_type:complete
MGIQTNIILGGLLLASLGGSVMYINMQNSKIDKLNIELSVAITNQEVLKASVEKSNKELQDQLDREKISQEKIAELTKVSNEARKEVSKLRNTFARHDLNSLAIAKGNLVENIINKGTARVNKELVDLTNPRQFDESITN